MREPLGIRVMDGADLGALAKHSKRHVDLFGERRRAEKTEDRMRMRMPADSEQGIGIERPDLLSVHFRVERIIARVGRRETELSLYRCRDRGGVEVAAVYGMARPSPSGAKSALNP